MRAEHGRLDGLVNNAAIPLRARVDEIELADWDRVLAVNLTGTLLGIQLAARLMTAGGSIVNVSSLAGLTGYHAAGYTVSKWGVRGLSRVASTELGPRGIRVNAIFPGYIDTPMTASAPRLSRRRTSPRRRSDGSAAPTKWRRSSCTSSPTSRRS